MLKKFGALAVALAVGGMLSLSGTAEAAKGFKHLSFMGNYLEKHPTVVNYWEPYFKATEEKFGGKLSFDYFATNALYPESEAPQAITDGRVDFGALRPAVYPGKYNLLNVVAIPGLCPNAIVGSLVAEDIIQKFPEVRAEIPPNSEHFTSWASAAYQLHTLKPVKTMEDLKGSKIIVWDAVTLEIVKALGANPIRMSSPDTYLALSKGMGDGVICPLAPLKSYKITEATKYHLMLNIMVQTFTMEANKDLWDSMPEDMKTYLKQTGGMEMALGVGKSLEDGAAEDTEWMKKQGHTFYYLTDEERAPFLAPLSGFVDDWKASCAGVKPEVIEAVYQYAQERAKFYTEEMRAGKYGDYKM